MWATKIGRSLPGYIAAGPLLGSSRLVWLITNQKPLAQVGPLQYFLTDYS